MDGEEPDGVGVLLLGHGLELARAHRLLIADEADEALDVAAAQVLVGAGEARELAHVGVAPPPVPLGEHGEVVVMVGDDPLAELLERKPGRGAGEPLEALEECPAKPQVLGREVAGKPALERSEERALRRCPADEDERVVGQADEGRSEHAHERLVVVAVVEEPQVREEVDHLLLAEVAAPGRPVRLQARPAQLLLVVLGVRAGREEEHDLAGGRLARVDELPHARGDVAGLGAAPVGRCFRVALLVGHQQLHGGAEDRVGEATRRLERLEVVAELAREEVVHRRQHLRPRAVVVRQGEHAARLLAPLAEDLDVGVPEAVDRLELVADEEELLALRALGEQVDELALEAVRVLELVDHDRPEAPALPLAYGRVVPQQVARGELEVLEVERRLAVLRRAVGGAEALEQLLEEVPVACGELVESGLLDRPARLLVRGGALAPRLELAEVEQALGQRPLVEHLERAGGCRAGRLPRLGIVRERLRCLAQFLAAGGEPEPLAQLELQGAPGRPERLVDAREHAP